MSGTNKLYQELSEEEREKQLDYILGLWVDFVKKNDASLKTQQEVFVNRFSLIEVVERVSKRKYYYKVFHGIDHLSEFKETALLCFWICKLKPFTVLVPASPLCASPNELFSLHLIYLMLDACKEHATNFHFPDDGTVKNFLYALKYQDLTKEALIQYMECLALSCGVNVRETQR